MDIDTLCKDSNNIILEFIKNNKDFTLARNSHFCWNNKLNLYLCLQREYINNIFQKSIVLDSLSVVDEKYLGTGNLTSFLDHLEPIAQEYKLLIVVNNILNDRLCSYLDQRCYKLKYNPSSQSIVYYKYY